MSTQIGTLWAQWVGWRFTHNSIYTYSIYPQNRNLNAETAITLLNPTKKGHWSETGISLIVSNGVVQTFDPPVPTITANNVTQITFRTASTGYTTVRGSHIIHYWI